MSVVMTINLILELSDKNIRKKILHFFEQKISEDSTNEISTYSIDSNYVLSFSGGDHWNIWYDHSEQFSLKFDLNYFLISYIEGETICFDVKLDDIEIRALKLSSKRYKKNSGKF